MKTNEISAKQLNAEAQSCIEKLRQVMLIQDKGKSTWCLRCPKSCAVW